MDMGIGYELINYSRKERLSFSHLPGGTMCELAGNPVLSAMIAWYMLRHNGDRIGFSQDTYPEMEAWPFKEYPFENTADYRDVTDATVNELIDAKILKDNGKDVFFADEPEVYVRRLEKIWLK